MLCIREYSVLMLPDIETPRPGCQRGIYWGLKYDDQQMVPAVWTMTGGSGYYVDNGVTSSIRNYFGIIGLDVAAGYLKKWGHLWAGAYIGNGPVLYCGRIGISFCSI